MTGVTIEERSKFLEELDQLQQEYRKKQESELNRVICRDRDNRDDVLGREGGRKTALLPSKTQLEEQLIQILRDFPLSRENDWVLYTVWVNKHVGTKFKSVERARRKIQAWARENNAIDLLPSVEAQTSRDEMEEEYREYASLPCGGTEVV